MSKKQVRRTSKKAVKAVFKLGQKNKWLALFICLAVVVGLLVLHFCFPEYEAFLFGDGTLPGPPKHTEPASVEGRIEVHIIDVGQADGILIRTEAGYIVVDAGLSGGEDEYVRYLRDAGVFEIEYLVLTHPHSDHIGGADAVLEEFDVKNVILPNAEHTSSVYMKVLGLIQDENANAILAKAMESYTMGDLKMTVLAPNGEKYDSLNDFSVVLRVEFGNTSFLLTGDAEKVSELEMISRIPSELLDCDVLKLGHHGSSTSTSQEFYDAVSPSYAAISCGKDNEYGHPHKEILNRLSDLISAGKVYRTDEDGSIVFTSDGNSISVSTER